MVTLMALELDTLRKQVDDALAAHRVADAVAYLAEMCVRVPEDRHQRTALAIALGDAGNPAGALKALRALADRLAHRGFLLGAMVVIRHGLEHAQEDPGLFATLRRLHVRGVRAKAGKLPVPPPLQPRAAVPAGGSATELLALDVPARLTRATEIACDLGPAGPPVHPLPMPLFSELAEEAFLETVKKLSYRRLGTGATLLVEGEPGDSLFIVVSGQITVSKGGSELATLGSGSVLGEMAIITGAPRSATAVAKTDVEVFELLRRDVEQLAREKPSVAEELVTYARKRLVANVLRTSALFSRFGEEDRYALLDRFLRRAHAPGTDIITQGAAGEGLHVIVTGEVQVSVRKDEGEPLVVANLGAGEVFGEISLLHDRPTTATVTARGQVTTLFLPKTAFMELVAQNPAVRDYLATLGEGRLEASRKAAAETEVIDADDLIVL